MADVKRNNVKLINGILGKVSGSIGNVNITKKGVIRLKRKANTNNKHK